MTSGGPPSDLFPSAPHHGEMQVPARVEAEALVEQPRAVLVLDVQERLATFVEHLVHERGHQRPRVAAALMGRRRADGADLRVAVEQHPLPGHGDQLPAVADAEIQAELDGAGEEGAGLGDGGELQHLRDVAGAEHDRLMARRLRSPRGDHLLDLAGAQELKLAGRIEPRARGERDGVARLDQREEVVDSAWRLETGEAPELERIAARAAM